MKLTNFGVTLAIILGVIFTGAVVLVTSAPDFNRRPVRVAIRD